MAARVYAWQAILFYSRLFICFSNAILSGHQRTQRNFATCSEMSQIWNRHSKFGGFPLKRRPETKMPILGGFKTTKYKRKSVRNETRNRQTEKLNHDGSLHSPRIWRTLDHTRLRLHCSFAPILCNFHMVPTSPPLGSRAKPIIGGLGDEAEVFLCKYNHIFDISSTYYMKDYISNDKTWLTWVVSHQS